VRHGLGLRILAFAECESYLLFRLGFVSMNGYGANMLRRFSRLILILVLAALAVSGTRIIYKNTSQNIALRPLPLDASNPERRTVGALTFLGAWELGSNNQNFGGISGLLVLKDGRFLGVSDAGTLIGFGLTNDDKTDRPFIAALPGAFGKNIDFRDRDSEGLAYDPQSGRIWVSYEAKHAVRRFPPSMSRIDGLHKLPGTKAWYQNRGIEAITRLRDGRFILIAEDSEKGDRPAYLYSGDPVEKGTSRLEFRYRAPAGYKATDATQLPDGRVLVLNRRIAVPDGFSAKLAILDPATISAGKVVKVKTIATLKSPLLVDNMEGITISQEDGRTIVWMISDNNFNIFQRTLLMKFALNLAPKKKPEADNAPGFDSL
jgi:hypothetical protein